MRSRGGRAAAQRILGTLDPALTRPNGHGTFEALRYPARRTACQPGTEGCEVSKATDRNGRLTRQADQLLRRLTLAEKVAMLHQWSPGVPRLQIPPFRTGTEALHGAAWLGPATVFPQPVGMAASWNPDLV